MYNLPSLIVSPKLNNKIACNLVGLSSLDFMPVTF